MNLQRTYVIETPGGRMVEMLFADKPAPEEGEAKIHFVVPVSAEGHPRIAQAQLEALLIVRNAIVAETQRLERIRGREHSGEDWS